MSAVPPVRKVSADVAAIRGTAAAVADLYAALHDSGYHRDNAADRAGGGRRIAEDGSENGSTANLGVGRDDVRDRLAAAAAGAELASTLLGGILVKLRQLATVIDRDAGHAPDELNELVPRTVLKAEVAEARARQARRDAEESLANLRRARATAGKERAKSKGKRGRAA